MGYRDYSVNKGLIVDATNHGDFATISAAMAVATSGQTIFVRPGTYTENFTHTPGVTLAAIGVGSVITPANNVKIIGKITVSAAGNYQISGITLQTNSDYALVVSGSGIINLKIDQCFLNCANNTGLNYTNSNSSSRISFTDCSMELATTGIAYYTGTATGVIEMYWCSTTNSGASSTASSFPGTLQCNWSLVFSPFATSSAGTANFLYCNINSGGNFTFLTTAGTGSSVVQFCTINTGSASSISIGSGTTVICEDNTIGSTNTNVITGAGTLISSNIIYTGSSHIQNVSTSTPLYSGVMYRASQQPAFRAALSTTPGNVTGDGTAYTVIFDTKAGDQGSNYNNSTGIFTCPVDGFYQFSTSVQISNLGAGHTSGYVQFTTTAGTASYNVINVGAVRDSANACCLQGSITLFLNATNTVAVQVIVSNSTKTVSVGAGTTSFNSFNGSLLC